MEEKIITKGKPINIFPIVIAIILLAVLCFIFIALPMIRTAYNFYGSDLASVMFTSALEVGISISIVLVICLFAVFVYDDVVIKECGMDFSVCDGKTAVYNVFLFGSS